MQTIFNKLHFQILNILCIKYVLICGIDLSVFCEKEFIIILTFLLLTFYLLLIRVNLYLINLYLINIYLINLCLINYTWSILTFSLWIFISACSPLYSLAFSLFLRSIIWAWSCSSRILRCSSPTSSCWRLWPTT